MIRLFVGAMFESRSRKAEYRQKRAEALARAEARMTAAHLAGVREYYGIWGDWDEAILRYARDLGVSGYKLEHLRIRVYCELTEEASRGRLPPGDAKPRLEG